MEQKKREGTRGPHDQLLTLVNAWDPAGSLASGAPRDTYEWIVDPLLNLLERSAPAEEIAAFLESEISDHFGVKPEGVAHFTNKVLSWYRMTASEQ